MPQGIDRSRQHVAQIIENVLIGGGPKWEWDDFTTIPIKDERLDEIREFCFGIFDKFSDPLQPDQINERGEAILRRLIIDLRGTREMASIVQALPTSER